MRNEKLRERCNFDFALRTPHSFRSSESAEPDSLRPIWLWPQAALGGKGAKRRTAGYPDCLRQSRSLTLNAGETTITPGVCRAFGAEVVRRCGSRIVSLSRCDQTVAVISTGVQDAYGVRGVGVCIARLRIPLE